MFENRQGDIYFEEVNNVNIHELKKYDSPIIAHGEVSGHCHQITDPPISECDSYIDERGHIFVRSDRPIKVDHDTHGVIELPANTWIDIFRQREYDLINEMRERQVAD